jgi:head-tail adaptor
MIGPRTAIGDKPHWLRFSRPGPPMPDPDGGVIDSDVPLNPAGLFGRIAPATQADMEQNTAGTVIATATHLVTIPFHPQITTETRVQFTDLHRAEHEFNVISILNPEMRDTELVLVCVEQVP